MQSPALSAACPACPVETTLTLISDKWKVLILRDLMPGTKRFGELKKSIGTVTQKVLSPPPVAYPPLLPPPRTAANPLRAAVAGSLKITIPSTTAPRAPIPVQTAYAVPMGKVFTAWAKSQTLAAIATTVRTEYPTLVKPSDSFIAVTQTISRHPAANRQIHAITPSSLSHQ